jgi:TIR domain
VECARWANSCWAILDQTPGATTEANVLDEKWDVFVSHATEDKNDFVRPLVHRLTERGLKVWFDEFTLKVGDSLRRSIDRGLAASRFGIVVISPDFLRKEWPQRELDWYGSLIWLRASCFQICSWRT